MLSFNFDGNSGDLGSPYRALLFVNGWMMGKRVGNLGCVRRFSAIFVGKELVERSGIFLGRKLSSPCTRAFSITMVSSKQRRAQSAAM
jgi:hypothetical protein